MNADVYYIQTEATQSDLERTPMQVLQPILDQVVALTSDPESSEEAAPPLSTFKPLLQMTYRQVLPSSKSDIAHPCLSSITFPPPSQSDASSNVQPVTSIMGLTDAAVQLAEEVYYDVLASRNATEAGGSTREERVQWIKKKIVDQKLERKRRKGRDPAEYRGRGGRGADDGITKEHIQEQGSVEEGEQAAIIGFFEMTADNDEGEGNEERE